MYETIVGAIVSFLAFTLATHPKSKINKKLPEKKIKNLQIFPRVSISIRDRVFHFHHWILLTPVYLFLSNVGGFLSTNVVHGLFLGGIMQGLMFRDRFRMVFRKDEYHAVKHSSFHIPSITRARLKRLYTR